MDTALDARELIQNELLRVELRVESTFLTTLTETIKNKLFQKIIGGRNHIFLTRTCFTFLLLYLTFYVSLSFEKFCTWIDNHLKLFIEKVLLSISFFFDKVSERKNEPFYDFV